MLWLTTSSEEHEAVEEIYASDDRAAAIVSASFLETRVEEAIRERLIDDEKGELVDELLRDGGPIGTFATKIRLGFAIGIYGPETKRDLHAIAKIRNDFAHELAIKSFEMQSITDRCRNLKLIDRFIYDNQTPEDQIRWVSGLTVKLEGRDARMAKARERYLATVGLISTALGRGVVQARDPSQAYSDSATGMP